MKHPTNTSLALLSFATLAWGCVAEQVGRTDQRGTSIAENAEIGQLTKVTGGGVIRTLAHDLRGRPRSSVQTIDGTAYTTTVTYDTADREVSRKMPDAQGVTGPTVITQYDRGMRPSSVQEQGGTIYVRQIRYDAFDSPVETQYGSAGSVVTKRTYRPSDHRLGQILSTYTPTSGPVKTAYHVDYTYDSVGNVLTTGVRSDFDPRSVASSYCYDGLGRITAERGATVNCTSDHDFVYDAIGNLLRKKTRQYAYGSAAAPHAASSAVDGGVTRAYAYDDRGNLERQCLSATCPVGSPFLEQLYQHDARALVTRVQNRGGTVQFSYDGEGNRFRQTAGSNITIYLDGATIDPGGTVTYRVAGQEVEWKQGRGLRFHLRDQLGSAGLTLNEDGSLASYTTYGAFGEASGAAAARYSYTSQERIAVIGNNVYHYNARLYDADLGRFLSADTVIPDPENPQAYNRYSYVYNNPIRNVDPTGHGVRVAGATGVERLIARQDVLTLAGSQNQQFVSFGSDGTVTLLRGFSAAPGSGAELLQDVYGLSQTILYEVGEQAQFSSPVTGKAFSVNASPEEGIGVRAALRGGMQNPEMRNHEPSDPTVTAHILFSDEAEQTVGGAPVPRTNVVFHEFAEASLMITEGLPRYPNQPGTAHHGSGPMGLERARVDGISPVGADGNHMVTRRRASPIILDTPMPAPRSPVFDTPTTLPCPTIGSCQ